jgi:transcriptional repressor NrdR
MQCPFCGATDSDVVESRLSTDQQSIRRRRECSACAKRFTTYERVEGVDITILKKNGTKEPFDREKMRKGIMKATWKRPIHAETIEQLINTIEAELREQAMTEITSWDVGNMVMVRLRDLDPIAYLLFASVYRDFQTIADFHEELKLLSDQMDQKADQKIKDQKLGGDTLGDRT